jgi:hypothetical protein
LPIALGILVATGQLLPEHVAGWAMIGGWPLYSPTLLTALDPAKVKIIAIDAPMSRRLESRASMNAIPMGLFQSLHSMTTSGAEPVPCRMTTSRSRTILN